MLYPAHAPHGKESRCVASQPRMKRLLPSLATASALTALLVISACTSNQPSDGTPQSINPEELSSRTKQTKEQPIGAYLTDLDGQIRAWNRLFLSGETDEDKRKARLLELNLMSSTKKRRDELLEVLASGALNNRIVAAAALGFTRDVAAQGPLLAALSEQDELLRSSALMGLWLLGRSDTPLDRVCDLLRTSTSEEERNIAALCLVSLVRAGAKSDCVLASARIGLVDPSPGVQSQCILLLANLKDAESLQPIADRLHDQTNLVALAAARALSYMGRELTAEKGRCARALVEAWAKAEGPRKQGLMRNMLLLEPPRNYGDKEEEWVEWALRLP